MRENYAKVFHNILFSSLWDEDPATCKLWLTLMVLADKHGEVEGNAHSLARIAKVSIEACRRALDIFLSPDLSSRTETCEGRRLETIEGGWVLLNHSAYALKASDQDRKEQAVRRNRRYRERESAKKRNTEAEVSEPKLTTRDACSRHETPHGTNSGMEIEMEMEMEPEREAIPDPDSLPKKAKPKKARRKKADLFTPAAIRDAVGQRVKLSAIQGFVQAVLGWSDVLLEEKKPWATLEALEGQLLKLETGHLSDALEIVELCRVNAWTGWIAGRDHLFRERGQSSRFNNQATPRGPEHEPF